MTARRSVAALALLLFAAAYSNAASLPSYFDEGKHTSARRSAADYLSGQTSSPCTQRVICHYVISASRAGIAAAKIKTSLEYISGYTYSEATITKWIAYVDTFDSLN